MLSLFCGVLRHAECIGRALAAQRYRWTHSGTQAGTHVAQFADMQGASAWEDRYHVIMRIGAAGTMQS
jgi:hypothetical protein